MAKDKPNIKGSINKLETYHTDAYMIAVKNGFKGTEEEWLYSLAEDANVHAQLYANYALESANKAEASNLSAGEHEAAAEASSNSASASALSASNEANRAETKASEAEAHKNAAEAGASQAAGSARDAAESARLADISNMGAKTSETNAKVSEINAKTSETGAKTSETNARASAESASVSASRAATQVTKAAEEVSKAKTEVEKAKAEVTNAALEADRAERAESGAASEAVAASQAATDASGFASAAESSAREAETARDEARGIADGIGIVQGKGDSELAVMSQKAVTELVGDLYDTDIPVGEIIDGKYIGPIGLPLDHASSCVTDFVPVNEGFTLHIKNCYLEEGRYICAYDENKKFISPIANATTETEITYTVPAGVAYIRITGKSGIAPSVEKINNPINAELALLKEKADKANEKIDDLITSEITPIHSVSGKFVNAQGGLTTDAASTAYFIKALGGKTVILSGVNAEYSRAIVLYDENGNFKECVATNQFVYDFTIDVEETSYIGFVALDGNFSAKYKDFGTIKDEYIDFDKQAEKYAENEYIGNYLPARRKIAESTIESGYLTAIGTVIADDNYRHTPFIEIEGGRDFIVTNLTPTANIALIFLDGRKNIIETVPHEYTGVAMEMEFTAPRNAAYIRFSLLKADADRVFVTYKEPLERNAHEKSILDGWFNDSFHKITTLFGDYVKQPLITIIDDDTVDVGQVQTFKDVCDANGIKGTYACITELATGHPELAELLHAVEQEGFHVCLHCRTHTNNPNIFSEPYFDPVAAEANIVQGCKDMLELGFADWRFWVTPGGESFPALQNLVRKWGFECVVTSDTNREIETTEAKRGRWYLSRPSWLSTADDVDDGDALISSNNHLTLKGWKAKADEVVANGGWLLVNTHTYGREADGWADPGSKSRRDFAAFVEYAKSIGCTFTTLNEAWRIKAPIYKFYELFI